MLSLAFTPKSLEVQRQVVIEEFKQNYLNQPYGDVYLHLKPLAYKVHPYQWNTIGKEISHIEKATMDDVKLFYQKFYNPDNAIVCLAGNVDIEEARVLSEKWFGDIPKGKHIERNYPVEPPQKKPRKLTLERNVPQSAIYMAWHMPFRTDPEYYSCDLISDLLSNGNSSRLYQHLVKEQKLFSELNAFITGDVDPGLFIVSGKLYDSVDFKTAEEAIEKELKNIKETPVSSEELKKVQNKLEANLVFSEISVLNRAMSLCYYEMLGNADLFNLEKEKYQSVTPDNIQKTANRIFDEKNKNVLYYKAIKK